MRPTLLKATATATTLVSAVLSAAYVSGHVKTASAPLHPAVASAAVATETLVVTARVRSADVQAVTSTYAS